MKRNGGSGRSGTPPLHVPDDSRPLRLADVQVLTMKMLEILRTSDRQ